MVYQEAQIAVTRINNQMANEVTLLQAAVASLLDKKAAKNFNGILKKLTAD